MIAEEYQLALQQDKKIAAIRVKSGQAQAMRNLTARLVSCPYLFDQDELI
jgi:hypothetical protein